MKERKSDFEKKAEKLKSMTDEELEKYFWELTEKVVDPIIDLSRTHTSQSIERSILLRMGFNSLQAEKLVDKIFEKHLLGKGAGHIIWKIAKEKNLEILEAGEALIEGKYWNDVDSLFKGGEHK